MKHLFTILFVCSFWVTCFAQRVTTIITSLNSNTSEAVTISTAWTGTDGDLVLSASVPASVLVGDTITDSAANTYLITGISGSTLTSQDYDTVTDPATGEATIQEAEANFTDWEANLDAVLYVSGDDAVVEAYNNGAFNITGQILVDGGGTVGLNSIKITVPVSERNDGTEGTGTRIVATSGEEYPHFRTQSPDIPITIEWLELDGGGINLEGGIQFEKGTGGTEFSTFARNLIVHGFDGTKFRYGIKNLNVGTTTGSRASIINNILYDGTQQSGNAAYFISGATGARITWALNNTVFNGVSTLGTVFGINIIDETNFKMQNNIAMDNEDGDYLVTSYSNATVTNNGASDASASGTGSLDNLTTANQFVSTGTPPDLHVQDTAADIFEAGTDLVTTPTGVNFDIDNYDRDDGATTWSIGAHDGNNLRGGAAPTPATKPKGKPFIFGKNYIESNDGLYANLDKLKLR